MRFADRIRHVDVLTRHRMNESILTLFAVVGVFGWSYSVLMPAFARGVISRERQTSSFVARDGAWWRVDLFSDARALCLQSKCFYVDLATRGRRFRHGPLLLNF